MICLGSSDLFLCIRSWAFCTILEFSLDSGEDNEIQGSYQAAATLDVCRPKTALADARLNQALVMKMFKHWDNFATEN